MDKFLQALSTKNAFTENGALTNSTSLNKCLDFFFVAGNRFDNLSLFEAAYGENSLLAMKILFWSRDCRGGAGARKNFITVMKHLQATRASVFTKVFKHIPTFGYWKDIYNLQPTSEVVTFVAETLKNEKDHSLCAKYCPRKGEWFYKLRKYLRMSPTNFRHFIVAKTQVVENLMCANKWDAIDYQAVPSVAGLRYRDAFMKHDEARYNEFVQKVLKGNTKINSGVLYPHDIYHKWTTSHHTEESDDSLRAMWENLPNYMEGCTERILPVCDVSGSMWGLPMDVSVALGCYISERNEGPFKDAFITFSATPELNYLKGDIITRFQQLRTSHWGFNTNLIATFELILNRAKATNLSQDLMPSKVLIISDMEFDNAQRSFNGYCESQQELDAKMETNFETIQKMYAEAGYEMPGIIFWNVDGQAGNVPATIADKVALVSGYSPSILTSVLEAKILSPFEVMLATVMNERYSVITV